MKWKVKIVLTIGLIFTVLTIGLVFTLRDISTAALVGYVREAPTTSSSAPSVAFDHVNRRWLTVYQDSGGQIIGIIMNYDGTLGDEKIYGDGATPSVAFGYSALEQRYLLAWEYSGDIFSVLLDTDGNVLTSITNLTSDSVMQSSVDVTFDSVNGRFAAVYQEWNVSTTSYDIKGLFLDFTTGGVVGSFDVTTSFNDQTDPNIAFSPEFERFAVVWVDERTGSKDIYYRLLDSDGTPLIYDTALAFVAGMDEVEPDVTWGAGHFFVVYKWYFHTGYMEDIYLQAIDPLTGELRLGGLEMLSEEGEGIFGMRYIDRQPSIAAGSNGRLIATWTNENGVFGGIINVGGIGQLTVDLLDVHPTDWIVNMSPGLSYCEETTFYVRNFQISSSNAQWPYVSGTTYPISYFATAYMGTIPAQIYLQRLTAFPLRITQDYTLPAAFINRCYPNYSEPLTACTSRYQLMATGGTGAYSWMFIEGELPDGLTFTTDGEIYGGVGADPCVGSYPCDKIFAVIVSDTTSPTPISTCVKFRIRVYRSLTSDVYVSPSVIDFGNVHIGSESVIRFTIGNRGYKARVTRISHSTDCGEADLPQPFSYVTPTLPHCPPKILEYDSDYIEAAVNFRPQVHGVYTDTIVIGYNSGLPDGGWGSGETISVPITGVGVVQDICVITPTNTCSSPSTITEYTVDFGDITVGYEYSIPITILNYTDGVTYKWPLTLTFVSPPQFPFEITNPENTGSPRMLVPGKSYTLWTRFSPDSPADESSVIYVLSDDPNEGLVTIKLEGTGILPLISISPDPLDCGYVLLGSKADCSFTIRNTGTGTLSISSIDVLSSEFSLESISLPLEIPSDATEVVTLTFEPDPELEGTRTAYIFVYSNAPTSPQELTVKGSGLKYAINIVPSSLDFGEVGVGEIKTLDVEVINSGSVPFYVSPSTGSENFEFASYSTSYLERSSSATFQIKMDAKEDGDYSANMFFKIDVLSSTVWEEVSVKGKVVSADITLEKYEIDFGGVEIGKLETGALEITNSGSYELYVYSISNISHPFGVTSGFPLAIPVGSSTHLYFTFLPDAEGEQLQNVYITTNDPDSKVVKVTLSGVGVKFADPTIKLEPDEDIDFGKIRVGEISEKVIIILNEGYYPLKISSISIEGGFQVLTLRSTPFEIPMSATAQVIIRFEPEGEGKYLGSLTITSNDPDRGIVELAIRGEGGIAKIYSEPSTIYFGRVRQGTVSTLPLKIINKGSWELEITGVVEPDPPFSISPSNFPRKLSEDDELDVKVSFNPPTTSSFSDEIIFFSDDPDNPEFSVSIAGKGALPKMKIENTKIDFGKIYVDEISSNQIIIINEGDFKLSVTAVAFAPFVLSVTEISVPADSSGVLEVEFHGVSPGDYVASITIFSDDPETPFVNVAVNGTVMRFEVFPSGGGGCSCRTVGGAVGGINIVLIFLAMLLLMLSRRVFGIFTFITIFVGNGLTQEVSISGLNSQLFEPNPQITLFSTVREATINSDKKLSMMTSINFVRTPLTKKILKLERGKLISREPIIDGILTQNTVILWNVSDKLSASFDIPLHTYMRMEEKSFWGIPGDTSVEGKINLEKGTVSLSLLPKVYIPTGNGAKLLGDSRLKFSPMIALSFQKVFALNVGMDVLREKRVGDKIVGPRLRYGIGFSYPRRNYGFSTEAFGSIPFRDISEELSPIELIFSGQYSFRGVTTRVGVGFGLNEGVGSPDFRVFASLGYDIIIPRYVGNLVRVSGRIMDNQGKPIPESFMRIRELGTSYPVSASGDFVAYISKGNYTFEAYAKGFEPEAREVEVTAEKTLKFKLNPKESYVFISASDSIGIPKDATIYTNVGESIDVKGTVPFRVKGGGKLLFKGETEGYSPAEVSAEVGSGEVGWVNIVFRQAKVEEKIPVEEIEEIPEEKVLETPEVEEEILEARVEEIPEGLEEVEEEISEELEEEIPEKMEKAEEKIQEEVVLRKVEEEIPKAVQKLINKVTSMFRINSWEIPQEAYPILDEVVSMLKKIKAREIILEGHTDITGPEMWNIELSYLRAESIRRYLNRKGIKMPIKVVGYGYSRPKFSNTTYEDRMKNRRVEIIIVY